jgi:hypothetical protein
MGGGGGGGKNKKKKRAGKKNKKKIRAPEMFEKKNSCRDFSIGQHFLEKKIKFEQGIIKKKNNEHSKKF